MNGDLEQQGSVDSSFAMPLCQDEADADILEEESTSAPGFGASGQVGLHPKFHPDYEYRIL